MNISERISQQEFASMVKKASPKSPLISNCIKAFLSGGLICAIGQILNNIYSNMGATTEHAAMYTSITLIFAAVFLTGLGLYHKMGKHCGAGTVVPITGFANSIAAPAIEFKKEGYVFGVGAKMFAVAGPVIVYGNLTSVILAVIYYFFGR